MLHFSTSQGLTPDIDGIAPAELHVQLAQWNHRRLAPGLPHDHWEDALEEDHAMRLLEGAWVERLRREVRAEAARAPSDVEGFIAWFEALKEAGPGQGDPLFG